MRLPRAEVEGAARQLALAQREGHAGLTRGRARHRELHRTSRAEGVGEGRDDEALLQHLGEGVEVGDARGLVERDRVRTAGLLRRERDAAAALVLGAEAREDGARPVDDAAGDVGGLALRRPRFEVEPRGEARDEVAPLGVERELHPVHHDRDGLRGGLLHAAVAHHHDEGPLAVADELREFEGRRAAPERVHRGLRPVHLDAVHRGHGGDLRARGEAPLGARDLQRRRDAVAGPVGLAHELELGLEPRHPVASNGEGQLRGRVARARKLQPERVLAAGLLLRDVPRERGDALVALGGSLEDNVAARPAHLPRDEHDARGGAREGVEQRGAGVHALAGLVERLVRREVCEQALGGAEVEGPRRRLRRLRPERVEDLVEDSHGCTPSAGRLARKVPSPQRCSRVSGRRRARTAVVGSDAPP